MYASVFVMCIAADGTTRASALELDGWLSCLSRGELDEPAPARVAGASGPLDHAEARGPPRTRPVAVVAASALGELSRQVSPCHNGRSLRVVRPHGCRTRRTRVCGWRTWVIRLRSTTACTSAWSRRQPRSPKSLSATSACFTDRSALRPQLPGPGPGPGAARAATASCLRRWLRLRPRRWTLTACRCCSKTSHTTSAWTSERASLAGTVTRPVSSSTPVCCRLPLVPCPGRSYNIFVLSPRSTAIARGDPGQFAADAATSTPAAAPAYGYRVGFSNEEIDLILQPQVSFLICLLLLLSDGVFLGACSWS